MRASVEVRRGAYHDSVTLMQVSRDVAAVDGVAAAQVAMGTELNLDLLRGMGFAAAGRRAQRPGGRGPRPTTTPPSSGRWPPWTRRWPRRPAGGSGGRARRRRARAADHRRSAARRTGGADLALVSVPGPHAFTEAMDALEAGLSRDGVQRQRAGRAGGPAQGRGCRPRPAGDGPGLRHRGGRRGRAGVRQRACGRGRSGWSRRRGTGAQQLMCLLDAAGVGVSHCLGVGGRDLSAAVAGRSTRPALAMLDDDPATELVVLVSKPPDPGGGRARSRRTPQSLATPVLLALLGAGQHDLTAAARRAVEAVGATWAEPWSWDEPAAAGRAAARCAGCSPAGTLCDEAMVIAAASAGRGPVQHPAAPGLGARPRPARRRARDGRLRRRRADPGPRRTR